ncbi:FecR domain-containing protein [Pseudomonas sp. S 311-6]|uniref:FecR family protein n=1 Tax=Kerstersia gyiorum TaxID=206506 RepID=UPI002096FFA7|nr:FecR domain-containing protein [Pseudomonas sp. S 311-6]
MHQDFSRDAGQRPGNPSAADAPDQEEAPVPRDIAQQAVLWLLTLQEDPGSRQTLREWLCWRDASPEHARAWRRIEALHGKFQQVQAVTPDSAAAARRALVGAPPDRRRRVFAGMMAALLVGGGAWTAQDSLPVRRWTAQVRTGKGERWQQRLDDGTELAVAGNSALNVRFDAAQRVIELLAGEVFISTAHATGESRPFLVRTPLGSAQALGTEYSVRLLQGQGRPAAQVAVFSGRVLVRPEAGLTGSVTDTGWFNGTQAGAEAGAGPGDGESAAVGLVLDAGEQVEFHAGGYGQPGPADVNRESWRRGMMVAHQQRLDVFLAELDPFLPFTVSVDPAVAGRRLSGSYPLDRPEDVIFSVARMLGLEVEAQRRRWRSDAFHLSARADGPGR